MTKEKLTKAKELECSISYLKDELKQVNKVISHGTNLIHVRIDKDEDAIMRNCYGIFLPYFKMYKRDLENKLSQVEFEFEEL